MIMKLKALLGSWLSLSSGGPHERLLSEFSVTGMKYVVGRAFEWQLLITRLPAQQRRSLL